MPTPGGWELVILIGILVLLFGAKRLPDMARSIGQSARVFKGEMKGLKDESGQEEQPAPTAPTRPAAEAPPNARGAIPAVASMQPIDRPSEPQVRDRTSEGSRLAGP